VRVVQSEDALAMHALVAGTVRKPDSFRSRRALGHNPAIEKYTYPAAVAKTERYERGAVSQKSRRENPSFSVATVRRTVPNERVNDGVIHRRAAGGRTPQLIESNGGTFPSYDRMPPTRPDV
jgi:hypothetical protein